MTPESLKIVIAEADSKISTAVKEYMERAGAKVFVAESGHEALSKIRKIKPDVIILETFLPGIEGLELCGRLKKDKRTKQIPIIFLTARDDIVDKVIGLEYGASDYITKPFSLRELEARIKAVLRNLPAKRSPGLNAANDDAAEEEVGDSVAVLFDFPEEVRADGHGGRSGVGGPSMLAIIPKE